MRSRLHIFILCSIPLLSLLLHFRIFSLDLIGPHVWRQTQTQTTILNFYREDMNILNPKINGKADTDRIMRMEFPLMQWIYACFYKLFGNHIIISRLLSFFTGLFAVFGMYRLLLLLFHDPPASALGAWAFNFSPVFYYYTLNPLPDNFALCLGIWGLAFFLSFRENTRWSALIASAIFLGLATAVKLPFILFLILPGYLLLHDLFRKKKNTFLYGVVLLAGLIPAIAWYAWVIPQWKGNMVVQGMMNNQRSTGELAEILWTHLISTLPELFLNYVSVVFFLAGIAWVFRKKNGKNPVFIALALWGLGTIAYLLFELNAIGKEHDYYLLPFLPLLFILVTTGIRVLLRKSITLSYATLLILAVAPLTAFLRADSRWDPEKPGLNIDLYRSKDELRRLVPEDALCIAGNDISQYIFLYYIDKKGFVFDQDLLYAGMLQEYTGKGATYLFTDSRNDEREDVVPFLEEKIFDKGTLRVYRLREFKIEK